MTVLKKAIFCWSGGKDSAYCLQRVREEKKYEVVYLLTTLNENHKRISMHGVRETLLNIQADSIGLPLLKVWVKEGTNEDYEKQMEKVLGHVKEEGIEHVLFGDIFLADLRSYREKQLAKVGMKAIFPLWETNTSFLIHDFVKRGFKSKLCCLNDAYFSENWLGKEIDESFACHLPSGADPCGENGEYHSFCYEGPVFKKKIDFTVGEHIYRALEVKTDSSVTEDPKSKTKGFWFCDLIPILA